MDDVNPYAATRVSKTLAAPEESWDGLWRDNKNERDLVMLKDARLPNICVKSGVVVTELGIDRKLLWVNKWWFLALFLHPIIFAVLAVVFSKKVTIVIPLCEAERVKRKRQLFAWELIGSLNLVVILGYAAILVDSMPGVPVLPSVLIVLGTVGVFIALFFGLSAARILRPVKITKTKVWLRGVHAEIVDKLPLLPQDMPD